MTLTVHTLITTRGRGIYVVAVGTVELNGIQTWQI